RARRSSYLALHPLQRGGTAGGGASPVDHHPDRLDGLIRCPPESRLLHPGKPGGYRFLPGERDPLYCGGNGMKNGNGPRPKTTGNLMRELMQTERLDRYLEKNDGQM